MSRVLLAEDTWLAIDYLPAEIRTGGTGHSFESSLPYKLPPGDVVLEELEKDLLRQALERTSGNLTRAARLLGINRDRIQKFNLDQAEIEAETE